MDQKQASNDKADGVDTNLKTASSSQRTEEKPSGSDNRPKEGYTSYLNFLPFCAFLLGQM